MSIGHQALQILWRLPFDYFFILCYDEGMNLIKTIVLVGMMGAGKTSIGWRLAKRLDVEFCDSDRQVEEAAQASVTDIYALWGESAFRKAEKRIVTQLLKNKAPHILSTGDGTFIVPEIRDLIKKYAVSVWLRAKPEILYDRVIRRNTRPQLLTGNPKHILMDLIQERYTIYEQADIIVQSDDESHEVTMNRVLTALEEYWGHKL